MKLKTSSRAIARVLLAGISLPVILPIHAESEDKNLEPLVVSALRTPRPASTVTSAVTVLEPEKLQDQGIVQLRDALNASPGVISTSTAGQTGAVGTLLIRGTKTAYSQVVVDGMRLSDSTTQLGNFLGSARTYDVGRLEILRGPQGAVYGGESVGGVLWMETPRGSGAPHGATTFEAGSFDSLAARSMFQGESGPVSYHLSGGYEETSNDSPNQDFHQGSTALRVEGAFNPDWTLGTTFRGVDSYFKNSNTSDNHLDIALATVYATGKISDCWTAHFLTGYHQEFYDNDDLMFGPFGTDLRAGSFSTDHEITLAENLRLLTGGFFHKTSYENTNKTDENGDRYGVHAALEWDIIENLTTTGAVRWEDYDAFGDEVTWRFGSIYNVVATGTSFRGGIGKSFRSPTYLDLFGSSFGAGNPNLDAESAIGWDLGLEQKIYGSHVVEVTWFSNRIEDQIRSSPTPPVNISGHTNTNGLEIGLRGDCLDESLSYRLAWTYLHESLSDQPRNAATASLDWKPTGKSLVGIGATHFSDHSWGGDPLSSYTVARLFGSYQVTENVKLHARVENVLDEDYELWSDAFGGPIKGAGTGLYAGVTVDW